MCPYQVTVDTFARAWTRTFAVYDEAATYIRSLRIRERYSAELTFHGNLLMSQGR